jgi:bacillopeptidase F (M6 metalloprotease family)
MADEKARKAAEKQAAENGQQQFEEWKKIQEDAGYTVEGDSFTNATVSEIEEGPTYNDNPGA